jgi:hypothetical protein
MWHHLRFSIDIQNSEVIHKDILKWFKYTF